MYPAFGCSAIEVASVLDVLEGTMSPYTPGSTRRARRSRGSTPRAAADHRRRTLRRGLRRQTDRHVNAEINFMHPATLLLYEALPIKLSDDLPVSGRTGII